MPALGSRRCIVLLLLIMPLVSGCALLAHDATNQHVVVNNEDSVPHDVVLVIALDGRQISTNPVRIAPNSSRTVSVINQSGRYEYRLKMDGERANTTVNLPVVEGDRRSFTSFTITKRGEVTVMKYHED